MPSGKVASPSMIWNPPTLTGFCRPSRFRSMSRCSVIRRSTSVLTGPGRTTKTAESHSLFHERLWLFSCPEKMCIRDRCRAWHTEHNRPVIMSELKTKAAHRDVPLPDCLAKCLREAKENSTSDYVVANSEGEPLSYTQFKRLWQYIVTRTVTVSYTHLIVQQRTS